MINATVCDSSTVDFEAKEYDTIILDSPYLTEKEFAKYRNAENLRTFMALAPEIYVRTPKIESIEKRVKKYVLSHKCWLVQFYNKPLDANYRVNWVREKGGLGGFIKKNTEYVHFFNYSGLKPVDHIDETIFIQKKYERFCSKPVKLYEEIFRFLGSKNVLDLFAGHGNSAEASHNKRISIDIYDIDSSLQKRYSYLNSLRGKKQLTLQEVT